MRSVFVALACCAAAFGQSIQIAPVPPDSLELVTGETRIPASPAQRGAIVNVTASTLYPAASGTMQESWVSGDNWRWSTTHYKKSGGQFSLPSWPRPVMPHYLNRERDVERNPGHLRSAFRGWERTNAGAGKAVV